MNRSIVITRYARTLVKYVRDIDAAPRVCEEAEALIRALGSVPDLRRMTEASDDVVSRADKKKLLQSALGAPMSRELSSFLTLLGRNGRMDLVGDILRDFVYLYYQSLGQRKVQLVTAVEPSESLLRRIGALVKSKTGYDAIIDVTVDPEIIGGFILDTDDRLLDASVKRQLDAVREQFIEQNRRII